MKYVPKLRSEWQLWVMITLGFLAMLALVLPAVVCGSEGVMKSYYVVYQGKQDVYDIDSCSESVIGITVTETGGDVIWLKDGVHFSDLNRIMEHLETKNPHLTNIVILGWYELKDNRIKGE